MDLEFTRDRRGRTHHRVVSRRGAVRVLRQPPPEVVRPGSRLGALLPAPFPRVAQLVPEGE